MSRYIFLDSTPLGQASNPKASADNLACAMWVQNRLAEGDSVIVPAVVDYELRRELIRDNK